MKIALYYAALNPKGSSAGIVERLNEKLDLSIDFKNVIDNPNVSDIVNYDFLIFLIATYGDQELQEHIEKFLISIYQDLTGKRFCVCELGNYYGYDDFSFGSGQIIENYLSSRNAQKYMPTSSIDSLPKIDWWAVDYWIGQLRINLKGH